MKWKGFGRKKSWPNLMHYPCICLDGLYKITEVLSQDSRSPGPVAAGYDHWSDTFGDGRIGNADWI
jgi:hypothetical protein